MNRDPADPARILEMAGDRELRESARHFFNRSCRHKYSYNFSSLGRPIIQYPQDMIAIQELIWQVRPDLIIETGIAHGGSLVMSASMLVLLDYCDAVLMGKPLDPREAGRKVVGIDVDIREPNRVALANHPLSHRMHLIEGSSVAPDIISKVCQIARKSERVMVVLDSNHTHEHVLLELEAYAPLTTPDSYCIVMDTVIEDMPEDAFPDRAWGKGDNPHTAVQEYLHRLSVGGSTDADGLPLTFEIDRGIEAKLLITVAPGGYMRRVH